MQDSQGPEKYLENYRKLVKRLEKGMHPVLHTLAEMGDHGMMLLDEMIASENGAGDTEMSVKKISFFNPRFAVNSDGRHYHKFQKMGGKIFVYPLPGHLVFWNDVSPKPLVHCAGEREFVGVSWQEAQGIIMPYDTLSNSFKVKDFEGTIKEVLGAPVEIDGKLFMLWWRDDGRGCLGNCFFYLDGTGLSNKGHEFHYADHSSEPSITLRLSRIIRGEEKINSDISPEIAKILYNHFCFDSSHAGGDHWDVGRNLRWKPREGWIEIKDGLAPTIITSGERQWSCLFYRGDLWVWPTTTCP